MGDRGAKTALFEQFARVGKAVASGKRLELLDLLAQGERTVDALARAAGLGLTTASAHLQTLKQANLVTTRRDGTKIYYRLAGDDVAALYALVQAVAGEHLADVAAARAAYLGPETEEVTREELLRRVQSGDATVIDVRPREEYAAGHIPRAVST
jgi:DNA-binding transcriptional ArsR family regulator